MKESFREIFTLVAVCQITQRNIRGKSIVQKKNFVENQLINRVHIFSLVIDIHQLIHCIRQYFYVIKPILFEFNEFYLLLLFGRK